MLFEQELRQVNSAGQVNDEDVARDQVRKTHTNGCGRDWRLS